MTAYRTVLVTGAQGFLGSWLTERLLDEGVRVVVPRREAHELSHFRLARLGERCDSAEVDLRDGAAVRRLLDERGVELVFHLAARTRPGPSLPPGALVEANLTAAAAVLEACRLAAEDGNPVRAVLPSSSLAYGNPDSVPVPESAPLRAERPYPVSKASIDMVARSYAETFGLPIAVTRLTNVYGGGDRNFGRLVPSAARAMAAGERPVIHSDGTPQREYLFVRDAVEAYLAIAGSLDDSSKHGRAWNVGTGELVSVLELVRRLVHASGTALEPDVRGDAPGGAPRVCLDSTAVRSELGWAPAWPLDRALEETWAWYARHLDGGGPAQRLAAEAVD